MKHICNPMNLEYAYQFLRTVQGENRPPFTLSREAADPSLALFNGKYYLFPSMTGGFFVSDDLKSWSFKKFLNEMPTYDYAPDVRVVGEYLYFCASKRGEICNFYRTKDPENEKFEEIKGSLEFWDPSFFVDDDGRAYLYWGCTNMDPIWGVELDLKTMKPIGEKKAMFDSSMETRGYERNGEDHSMPSSDEGIEAKVDAMVNGALQDAEQKGTTLPMPEEELRKMIRGYMSNRPYIEGAWMTKHDGKYYLQYAIPGTQYNVYNDGCFVSDSPLGPYAPLKNNPYSYVPAGFITGAGHGSTMEDKEGRFWHAATMRISNNHNFERRLGFFKAGFDKDGELFCDQRFADYPMDIDSPAFTAPDYMLLSYGKKVTVSSGTGKENLTDENVRTYWVAETENSGEWAEIDLGKVSDVRAIQINFADSELKRPIPDGKTPLLHFAEERYIAEEKFPTTWKLEGSLDGKTYFSIEDKWNAKSDLPHDYVEIGGGVKARYIKLTINTLPYNAKPTLSGIRVFGIGDGKKPEKADEVVIALSGDLDMDVSWKAENAIGANILWGYAEDKLYHSCLTYGKKNQKIGALIKDQSLYVRIDAFNENGITEGDVIKVK